MQILCNEVVESSLLANSSRERDLVIEIEFRITRRNPFEIPARRFLYAASPLYGARETAIMLRLFS
jgi:hypothetical protein